MYIVLHQLISKSSKNPSNSFPSVNILNFIVIRQKFTLPVMFCFQLWSQTHTFPPETKFHLINCLPKIILKWPVIQQSTTSDISQRCPYLKYIFYPSSKLCEFIAFVQLIDELNRVWPVHIIERKVNLSLAWKLAAYKLWGI